MTTQNILLQEFDYPPFSKIKDEDFKPGFQEALKQAQTEINAIVNNKETPDFKNTIEALDFSGVTLNRISAIFFNLNSAETNPEIQKIAQEVSPWLSKFQNDITLNEDLFKRVESVYQSRSNLNLTEEQKTLLDKYFRSFTRNGAKLPAEKKEKLREIDKQLSQLGLSFGENVLADTNNYQLFIKDEKEIDELPEGDKETAAALAKSKNRDGYLFTLHHPSYGPFMKYVKNRDLRKKLALAQGAKGFQNNENNNEENVLKIVNLRYERAKLLGFKSHADFVLQERMAKTPEKVTDFLNNLVEKARPAAQKQFKELEDFARELDGIDKFQSWDSAYYAEKLKQKKYELHEEELKPYFQLDKVIGGAFAVANKLYGVTFKEVFDIDKYQEEVKTFKVFSEDGVYLALLYADFHPREGKRNGAWMTSYKDQEIKNGINERPQASIVCNFSRPTSDKPALLTFQEVITLFHEFGHSLHAMLANTTYPGLSGTSVYWDFVELPSQVMENWCYEKEALELFAKHYKTGAIIPMELIEKIKKAANFLEGMQTLRQLSFGILDMAWHGDNPSDIKDVKKLELKSFAATRLYPDVPENCMSTAFGHIFSGGYSSGYYSYKWAEVLDADAFEYFKENGIFNQDIASKFKENILTKGGTEDPMVLYKRFRGKKPDPEALLKRAGLLA